MGTTTYFVTYIPLLAGNLFIKDISIFSNSIFYRLPLWYFLSQLLHYLQLVSNTDGKYPARISHTIRINKPFIIRCRSLGCCMYSCIMDSKQFQFDNIRSVSVSQIRKTWKIWFPSRLYLLMCVCMEVNTSNQGSQ